MRCAHSQAFVCHHLNFRINTFHIYGVEGGGDEFIGATIGNRISSLSNQDNAARVLMHGVSGGGGSSGSFPT